MMGGGTGIFEMCSYKQMEIEHYMTNEEIGRLITDYMKRTNGKPLLIVFPEYDNGDEDDDKIQSDINNIKEIYSDDELNRLLEAVKQNCPTRIMLRGVVGKGKETPL